MTRNGTGRRGPSEGPVVRAARPEDAGALARLTAELGYETTDEKTAARVREILENPTETVLVAEDPEASANREPDPTRPPRGVTGWIHVATSSSLESAPFAEIRGLVVTATRRERGIGRALVAAAESWARERGHRRIRVRSRVEREAAHGFYERDGYARAKTQHVFDKQLG